MTVRLLAVVLLPWYVVTVVMARLVAWILYGVR